MIDRLDKIGCMEEVASLRGDITPSRPQERSDQIRSDNVLYDEIYICFIILFMMTAYTLLIEVPKSRFFSRCGRLSCRQISPLKGTTLKQGTVAALPRRTHFILVS
jgi:hypothetical protein